MSDGATVELPHRVAQQDLHVAKTTLALDSEALFDIGGASFFIPIRRRRAVLERTLRTENWVRFLLTILVIERIPTIDDFSICWSSAYANFSIVHSCFMCFLSNI